MFFLIMLIGYICRKIGVFKDTTGKTISSIVINIGNPALIIASGMNPERLENKGKLLFTLGVALIYFAQIASCRQRGLRRLSGHDAFFQYWIYGLSLAGCHVWQQCNNSRCNLQLVI